MGVPDRNQLSRRTIRQADKEHLMRHIIWLAHGVDAAGLVQGGPNPDVLPKAVR